MVVETDRPTDIHQVTSVFAAFEFKVELVEVEAVEYRRKNAP